MKGTPSEVVARWVADGLINSEVLLHQLTCNAYCEDLTDCLKFVTTEDEELTEEKRMWVNHLMINAAIELPEASTAWKLEMGVLYEDDEPCFYLAGDGQFDSSFPILIFRKDFASKFEEKFIEWKEENDRSIPTNELPSVS